MPHQLGHKWAETHQASIQRKKREGGGKKGKKIRFFPRGEKCFLIVPPQHCRDTARDLWSPSKGGIFFEQVRVVWGKKRFTIYELSKEKARRRLKGFKTIEKRSNKEKVEYR